MLEAEIAAVLGGAAGLAVGIGAMLAFRASERSRAADVASLTPPADPLDPSVSAILSVLPGSWVLVSDGAVLRCGPAALTLGVVRDNRIHLEPLRELVEAVRRDGEVRVAMIEARRRGTHVTPVLSVRVAPLPNGMILVLVEDGSEARRVEDVRRDFVANVSHELKTPIGAISLLSEALDEASDDPETVKRFTSRMQREATRLAKTVNELIDLSRLQSHDPLADPVDVDIDSVIAESIDSSRVQAQALEIELSAGGDPGLLVYGDREQLVTAVRNLLDNAISYSPPRTKVAVVTRQDRDRLEVSVTDQGIGIPAAHLDRIFERFYRVDPARSRETGGTGLGLSLVKHVAANHGGKVTVWSEEGAGSTFTLQLPLSSAHDNGKVSS